MLRNLPLIIASTLVFSLAAFASAAALNDETPTPSPSPTPVEETPTPTPGLDESPDQDEETGTPTSAPTPVPDDEEDVEAEVTDSDEAGDDDGKQAAAIAAFCGKTAEEIEAIHAGGVGWGALFKVCQLSIATGEPVEDILDDAAENGFAFGNRFRSLTDEQEAALDDLPKNLGHAMHDGDGDSGEEAATGDAEQSTQDDEDTGPGTSRGHGRGRKH
jgi:hypothetical protein